MLQFFVSRGGNFNLTEPYCIEIDNSQQIYRYIDISLVRLESAPVQSVCVRQYPENKSLNRHLRDKHEPRTKFQLADISQNIPPPYGSQPVDNPARQSCPASKETRPNDFCPKILLVLNRPIGKIFDLLLNWRRQSASRDRSSYRTHLRSLRRSGKIKAE